MCDLNYREVLNEKRELAICIFKLMNHLIDSGWSTEDIKRYCTSQLDTLDFYTNLNINIFDKENK